MADDDPFDELGLDEDEAEPSDWNWWLLTIPILAVITLVVVLLYGMDVLVPSELGEGVELFHVVLAGTFVLVALLIVEFALLMGKHPENLEDDDEPAPAPERPAARHDEEAPDLEAVATDDEVEGRQVVEVARPPKWAVDAGVYATTYVEVNGQHMLRLEEIVALRP